MSPKLDAILNKFISKKLTVFLIATFFVIFKSLETSDWVDIAMIYIAGQSVIDTMTAIRGKR